MLSQAIHSAHFARPGHSHSVHLTPNRANNGAAPDDHGVRRAVLWENCCFKSSQSFSSALITAASLRFRSSAESSLCFPVAPNPTRTMSNHRSTSVQQSVSDPVDPLKTLGYIENPFRVHDSDTPLPPVYPEKDIVGVVLGSRFFLEPSCDSVNHTARGHQCPGHKQWILKIQMQAMGKELYYSIPQHELKDAGDLRKLLFCTDIKKRWLRGALLRKHHDHLYEIVRSETCLTFA